MAVLLAGTHVNDKCCFDYGNAETNDRDDGAGTMEAVSARVRGCARDVTTGRRLLRRAAGVLQ